MMISSDSCGFWSKNRMAMDSKKAAIDGKLLFGGCGGVNWPKSCLQNLLRPFRARDNGVSPPRVALRATLGWIPSAFQAERIRERGNCFFGVAGVQECGLRKMDAIPPWRDVPPEEGPSQATAQQHSRREERTAVLLSSRTVLPKRATHRRRAPVGRPAGGREPAGSVSVCGDFGVLPL
jgi:hypothetical protein